MIPRKEVSPVRNPRKKLGKDAFSVQRIKERNQGKPGQEFEVEIWVREDQKNPGEETEEDIPFFHGFHLKKKRGIFQGGFQFRERFGKIEKE